LKFPEESSVVLGVELAALEKLVGGRRQAVVATIGERFLLHIQCGLKSIVEASVTIRTVGFDEAFEELVAQLGDEAFDVGSGHDATSSASAQAAEEEVDSGVEEDSSADCKVSEGGRQAANQLPRADGLDEIPRHSPAKLPRWLAPPEPIGWSSTWSSLWTSASSAVR
jgi:hypothetical protein